jgi:hypothetical protein
MKKNYKIFGIIILMLVLAAFVCGCTSTQTEVTPTPTPTEVSTPMVPATATEPEITGEWILWREGAGQTLGPLGDYQAFTPNVDSEQFMDLRIQVVSSDPITVMFFNDSELKNFRNKMATNQGSYTPISTYNDVVSRVLEESSDEHLNIVLYNPGQNTASVTDATIWYMI